MRQGFSLIELSIVLVILGLLAGGILAGQSLIRAAEIRNVTSDFSRYSTAVYTFRDKYFALPGDMNNATAFWGAADGGNGTGSDCIGISASGTATCNGNGNGNIEELITDYIECYRAWQHLANAGLVEGTYTGVNGPGTSNFNSVPGSNIPKSRVESAGWALHSAFFPPATDNTHFIKNYSIRLQFGRARTNGTVDAPALTPTEMWNIDTKLDDGKPGLGRIMTNWSSSPDSPCATTDDQNTAVYPLNVTAKQCIIIGQPGF